MPKTAAATTTAFTAADAGVGTVVAAAGSMNNLVITLELTFDGVNFTPSGLRAALDAAYPTVESLTDGAERPYGPFRFRIAP